MESRKERQGERGTEGSPTVNYIYGLSFQGCTFHDTTFQTLAQEGVSAVSAQDACAAESDVESVAESCGASRSVLPDTPEVRSLMARLVEAGLLDAAWQPVGLSNAQKGVLALLLARRLDIPNLWQVFGGLWGMKPETLRTACNKGMEQRRTMVFMERVKRVMEDL